MSTEFDEMMGEVRGESGAFGHREHIHLAWLAVRRYGRPAAIERIGAGIKSVAEYAGRPQKYNVTMTRAWVELVAHHALASSSDDFEAFARANPALFDKRLLSRFYRSATLASRDARTGWTAPDLRPFPWARSAELEV